MIDYDEFISKLEPINEKAASGYTLISFDFDIQHMTDKAILVDGEWLPLSQMRVGRDGNLYMKNWLYDKYMWE